LPSDTKAASIVEDYYLFAYGGKQVEAEVVERGKFIKECKCYPIKFKIMFLNRKDNNKTFYFYKSRSGEVKISEYLPQST
jgi:hypothetical protein